MKKKIFVMALAGMLVASLAAGCGSGSKGSDSVMNESASSSAMDTGAAMDAGAAMEEGIAYDVETDEASDSDAAAGEGGQLGGDALAASNQSGQQKLIYTYNYSVETREFDAFLEHISAKVEALGGYVESSETSGSSADVSNRYASMTLRIPADQMSGMLSMVQEESNVTYSNKSSRDVTLSYVDTESHLKALRVEQESLIRLLEKAQKVQDIISLQEQLTQVRYEIESCESQLRSYDNLINYSTLYLDVREVDRTTSVMDVKASFGEEVEALFGDNVYAVGRGLRGLAIWFLGSLPVIIPLAVILAAAVLLLRRFIRKKAGKGRAGKAHDAEQNQDETQ